MQNNFDNWCCRASSLGNIIAEKPALTPAQQRELNKLNDKVNSGKPLTELQIKKLGDIRAIEKQPRQLSKGAKTYLDGVFNELYYGRKRIDTGNKYTRKGNYTEQDVFDLYSLKTGRFVTSFKTHLNNEYIHGTPDVVLQSISTVIDAKSKWDLESFQKSELTKLYQWQGKGYNYLTGTTNFTLACGLVNAPLQELEKEKEKVYYWAGQPEGEDLLELMQQVERNMIFDFFKFQEENPDYNLATFDSDFETYTIDETERLRLFHDEYTAEDEKTIIESVKLAREYLNSKL
jgi:hypothetical protein